MTLAQKTHYLKDYRAVDFIIENISLVFDLSPENTQVQNVMKVVPTTAYQGRMTLDGEHLQLTLIKINGVELPSDAFECFEGGVHITTPLDIFELEIHTLINPQSNTRLEGLYLSGGNYCTQCEAEGFRCITYFPDRPDVLTRFTTKIIADKTQNPVLLSNGNLVETGDLDGGKHFAVWHDPFAKPCYLFALVAGDLCCMQESFLAADGRLIRLEIYTDAHHIPKCQHAMASLIKSMRWDEERFGLIYDLERYMIVAVDDFNMGAMENKGLNIFNSKYVLADPMSATDEDYEGVEAVIAHEYFHNWTGNRVTCRDWFQLTLKEGLTVFRDQEFTADQLSPSVKRIEDVRRLRSLQFAEDAGPMSHPIQPQSYVEMNNFYTLTVYEKGAEVVRLYQTLLGKAGFRKGMDLYFERHDGQAVTIEDFRNAMSDANQTDLSQMQAWYVQSGTPQLKIRTRFCRQSHTLEIGCEQFIKGVENFEPLLIPLKCAFYDSEGRAIALCDDQIEPKPMRYEDQSVVLLVNQPKQVFKIKQLKQDVTPSWLQGFSAPVKLDFPYSEQQLFDLAHYDQDSFNRWEAIQRLALQDLMAQVAAIQQQASHPLSQTYCSVFSQLLQEAEHSDSDAAWLAYALALPDLGYLVEQYEQLDIEAVLQAHRWMKQQLGQRFLSQIKSLYLKLNTQEVYCYEAKYIAKRLLKNRCLDYLVCSGSPIGLELAEKQYQAQLNMTDVSAALKSLTQLDTPQLTRCLDHFYDTWQHEPLVLDKWFAFQAMAQKPNVFEHLGQLLNHEKFHYQNPNRARSVIGTFARLNLAGFHHESGQGYRWLADQVILLDKINPQVAARMLVPLTHWQRLNAPRQALMREELMRIKQQLQSRDVDEIVSKSLNLP